MHAPPDVEGWTCAYAGSSSGPSAGAWAWIINVGPVRDDIVLGCHQTLRVTRPPGAVSHGTADPAHLRDWEGPSQ